MTTKDGYPCHHMGTAGGDTAMGRVKRVERKTYIVQVGGVVEIVEDFA